MSITGIGSAGVDPASGMSALSALLKVAQSAKGAGGSGNARVDPDGDGDSLKVSGPGQLLSNLQQLQKSDPNKFKQVVTDIADKLSQAAQQQGQTPQGQLLAGLAAKFQSVAQTGDLSQLQPPAPAADAHPASGRHHGMHHAGGASGGSSLSTLFSQLNQEVNQALGTGTGTGTGT